MSSATAATLLCPCIARAGLHPFPWDRKQRPARGGVALEMEGRAWDPKWSSQLLARTTSRVYFEDLVAKPEQSTFVKLGSAASLRLI